ncbi:MAG: mucoidy inhibitor MuiA family protein [Leptospiraceae bacterium]|nr:mucoidy inhibitor MuiA family protein [Leptospiraceae bacterium]MCP5494082.1 mucoidy inhibitor MuiA family protein [Leptospiraceae bacterium]
MNKILTIYLVLFYLGDLFADDLHIPVKEVLVYNDRAQVTRKIKINFQTGESIFKIIGLPVGLLDENLRAYTEGSNNKVSVSSISSYIEPHLYYSEEEVRVLSDDIDKKETEKKKLQVKIQNYNQEKTILTGFENLTIESISKKVAYIKSEEEMKNWKETILSFRSKRLIIERELHQIDVQLKDLEQVLDIQKKKLDEIISKVNKSKRITEIKIVNVDKEPIQTELNVSYIILGSSWKPVYNVTIHSTKNAEIEYMADILQETGEDWNNVKISLSTAEPRKIQARPKVRAVEILKEGGATQKEFFEYSKQSKEEEDRTEDKPTDGTTSTEIEGGVVKAAGSLIFHSPETSSIPSEKKYHRILIAKYQSGVKFEYVTIPKIKKAVYLMAKLKNNIRFPMLAGALNIFRESGYIGESGIPYVPAYGEYDVSLGSQIDFRVFYRMENNVYKSGIVSKQNVFEKTEHISIENFSKNDNSITLISNVPATDISDIEVEIDQKTTVGYTEKVKNSGIYKWKIPIKSYTKKRIFLKYRIKVPKDSPLRF